MLKPGPAKKVTVYVGEDVHHRGEPLYLAVLNYLFTQHVAGATVVKGRRRIWRRASSPHDTSARNERQSAQSEWSLSRASKRSRHSCRRFANSSRKG